MNRQSEQRRRQELKRDRRRRARRAAAALQKELRNRPIKRMMREYEATRVGHLIAAHRRAKAMALLERKHGHTTKETP